MSMDADTSILRPATGLDRGARQLLLEVVGREMARRNAARTTPELVVAMYFKDRYGGLEDYLNAVAAVWGQHARYLLGEAVDDARAQAQFNTFVLHPNLEEAATIALLMHMPEPDFRLASEVALRNLEALGTCGPQVTAICRNRGIPWRLDATEGFVWTGDDSIERDVLRPALSKVNDPRFGGGVRSEFEQARAELKLGSLRACKQALHEASCAVESAMKVVLTHRGISFPATAGAQILFERMRDEGLVAQDTECLLLAAPRARNKRAGHGAGAMPHTVTEAEAQAFVAAAATALSFLGALLP